MNALIAEARLIALTNGQRPLPQGTCVIYFLRLQSGLIYVGASEDLEQRLADHSTGRACRTTQLDPPVRFLHYEIHPTFSAARARETQLKRWSRAKKEALIAGDLDRLHALSRSRETTKSPGARPRP